jgi:hypothetical protein
MRASPWLLACAVVVAACSDTRTSEPVGFDLTASQDSDGTGDHPPALIHPRSGTRVRQNDPTLGCPFDANRGYGFGVLFVWESLNNPNVAAYQLLVQSSTATLPAVQAVTTESSYQWLACNSFVTDENVQSFTWKVRAVGVNGVLGAWSETRRLPFGYCRKADGTPCSGDDD